MSVTAHASTTLFSENFNGYTSFPDQRPNGDIVNLGVPKVAEGAQQTWYGARFIKYTGQPSVADSQAVQKTGGGGNNTPTGRTEGGAAMLFKVDTTGYENITLTFDWRTFNTSSSSADLLKVGYTKLNLTSYFDSTMTNDFYEDLKVGSNTTTNNNAVRSWLSSNWTFSTLGNNNTFHSATINLPSDMGVIWVAFFMDAQVNEYGKFDNVVVKGDLIPPPPPVIGVPTPAALPAGLALMGLINGRRRKA
ncbi:MAG: hypothetical protein GC162_08405 [Planctomycetes bacterium]|nr:hypothetical protein [Planctomycetota bacterium]